MKFKIDTVTQPDHTYVKINSGWTQHTLQPAGYACSFPYFYHYSNDFPSREQ